MRTRKKIKRAAEVVLADAVLWTARTLPRRAGYRLFSSLGSAAGYLLRKDRERAVDNLEIAFPDMPRKVREAMARAMFKSVALNAYEFLALGGSGRDRIAGMVERVEGREHLDAVTASGRGLIAITGHIGCWELLAAYWANTGFEVNVIGRELWEKRINDRVVKLRASAGYRTIDRDTGGKELLRILKNGGAIAALIDQHTRVSGVYVPFFSKPAHTPIGVAKMALATGAEILPMAIYMTSPGRHVIRILPPVEIDRDAADKDNEAREVTARSSRAIEELIRFDPKQWVWFHRRWREPGPESAEVGYATVS